jgi:site-specific recombinase XerD
MNSKEVLKNYADYLTLINYRPQTKESYIRCITKFLEYCVLHSDQNLSPHEYAKNYLIHRFNSGLTWSSVNIDYSSLRLFFNHVVKVEWDYKFIPRPRGHAKVHTVLSLEEIELLINAVSNLKHKTILILLYSSGVRVGELINLKIADLLLDRDQLKVDRGKGGKDRIIYLPSFCSDVVNTYLLKYKPKKYVIEGHKEGYPYSFSSVRMIIRRLVGKCNIIKDITTHSFRYAYATHHVENGTDLVTLQNQLGHKGIQTTINYIKLCSLQSRQINHPIDLLHIDLPPSITLVRSSGRMAKNI